MIKLTTLFLLLLETYNLLGNNINKEYTLWYNRPAFNRGGDFTYPVARGYPYDEDWER